MIQGSVPFPKDLVVNLRMEARGSIRLEEYSKLNQKESELFDFALIHMVDESIAEPSDGWQGSSLLLS